MAARLFRIFWLTVLVSGTRSWRSSGGGCSPAGSLPATRGSGPTASRRSRHWPSRSARSGPFIVNRSSRFECFCPSGPRRGPRWRSRPGSCFRSAWRGLARSRRGGRVHGAARRIPVCYHRPRASTRAFMALAGTIIVSATTGAALAYTQRVPGRQRIRLTSRFPSSKPALGTSASQPGAIRLDGNVLIQSSDGSITVPLGRLTLMVDPLLLFSSRRWTDAPRFSCNRRCGRGRLPGFGAGVTKPSKSARSPSTFRVKARPS